MWATRIRFDRISSDGTSGIALRTSSGSLLAASPIRLITASLPRRKSRSLFHASIPRFTISSAALEASNRSSMVFSTDRWSARWVTIKARLEECHCRAPSSHRYLRHQPMCLGAPLSPARGQHSQQGFDHGRSPQGSRCHFPFQQYPYGAPAKHRITFVSLCVFPVHQGCKRYMQLKHITTQLGVSSLACGHIRYAVEENGTKPIMSSIFAAIDPQPTLAVSHE